MRKGVSVKKKMVRQRIIVPYYGIQNNPADNTIRTEGVFEELSQMKHEKQEVSGCWDCKLWLGGSTKSSTYQVEFGCFGKQLHISTTTFYSILEINLIPNFRKINNKWQKKSDGIMEAPINYFTSLPLGHLFHHWCYVHLRERSISTTSLWPPNPTKITKIKN